MKRINLIAYRQGNNWMINNNGYVYSLPYWVKTKKDVREYFVNANDDPATIYSVTFA